MGANNKHPYETTLQMEDRTRGFSPKQRPRKFKKAATQIRNKGWASDLRCRRSFGISGRLQEEKLAFSAAVQAEDDIAKLLGIEGTDE